MDDKLKNALKETVDQLCKMSDDEMVMAIEEHKDDDLVEFFDAFILLNWD